MTTIKVGVQLQPHGTTVEQLRRAWEEADAIGCDSIWTWDHFFPIIGDPDATHFEGWTLLAAMAATTSRARIGLLVTSNTYRNPDLLADMARTVDHISNGRTTLGIGAGWFERDHREYGFEFGTAPERLRRLEQGLQRIRARLERLDPGPRGPLPILIGGGGERVTLRLVARYADMWNRFGDVATLRHKNQVIDEWCAEVGRDPEEIERSTLQSGEVDLEQLAGAGIDHLIVGLSAPFDLSAVQRLLAQRG